MKTVLSLVLGVHRKELASISRHACFPHLCRPKPNLLLLCSHLLSKSYSFQDFRKLLPKLESARFPAELPSRWLAWLLFKQLTQISILCVRPSSVRFTGPHSSNLGSFVRRVPLLSPLNAGRNWGTRNCCCCFLVFTVVPQLISSRMPESQP